MEVTGNDILEEITFNGAIERRFMSFEEIKVANILVKKGLLYKGHTDTKNPLVQYNLI